MIVDERMNQQPGVLLEEVRHLVRSPKERETLAQKLHDEAMPDAAERLARVILEVGEDEKKE